MKWQSCNINRDDRSIHSHQRSQSKYNLQFGPLKISVIAAFYCPWMVSLNITLSFPLSCQDDWDLCPSCKYPPVKWFQNKEPYLVSYPCSRPLVETFPMGPIYHHVIYRLYSQGVWEIERKKKWRIVRRKGESIRKLKGESKIKYRDTQCRSNYQLSLSPYQQTTHSFLEYSLCFAYLDIMCTVSDNGQIKLLLLLPFAFQSVNRVFQSLWKYCCKKELIKFWWWMSGMCSWCSLWYW